MPLSGPTNCYYKGIKNKKQTGRQLCSIHAVLGHKALGGPAVIAPLRGHAAAPGP